MPVVLDTPSSRGRSRPVGRDIIEIGLLNNLSDAGLEGGERQFIDLLTAAAGSRPVRLKFYSLPEIERGPEARARMTTTYQPFATLFDTHLDGLIVTGAEPRAPRLQNEPFWSRLTEVMDWADRSTRSTIWSCLAAHAAVLHFDGIERRRLTRKYSGIYAVQPAGSHDLLAGVGATLSVCHSRYNDLDEHELVTAGYDIVTRSAAVGVDAFTKQGRSLSLFLQGHPEYDSDALFREYRRDVSRYLDGTSETYPAIPDNYAATALDAKLRVFEAVARDARDPALFTGFPVVQRGIAKNWSNHWPVTLIGNWLTYLHAKTAAHAALA